MVSNTGAFKNYNITLPYSNGTSNLYTVSSQSNDLQSSDIYRIDRVTLNGTHTIKVYKNGSLYQESSFNDNSDKSKKISNGQFTLPFSYTIQRAPDFLNVSPSQGTTSTQSQGSYQIDVVSSHNGTVSGIPSWASTKNIQTC